MLGSSIVDAERITDAVTFHGEGPYWDAAGKRLLCVDLLAGAVVSVATDVSVARYRVPSSVAALVRRRRSGGFVIATERGVLVSDDEFSEFDAYAELSADPQVRANDGGCDPLGSLLVGTMAYDGRPGAGALYRLTPGGGVSEVLTGVSISNGLQWSGDGSRVYYIDSPTGRVDVFDVDTETGNWSGRRPYIEIAATVGVPDGMAIDEEGGLWVALWGGGAVHHYDSAGRLVETIRVPGVTQVSSCAFGGEDRSLLYITTSRQGLTDDAEPDAGALFAFPASVRGAVPFEFGG